MEPSSRNDIWIKWYLLPILILKKKVSPPPRRVASQLQSCLGACVVLYFSIWINHLLCVRKAHQVWRLDFCNGYQIIQTQRNYIPILTVVTYQITEGGIENYLVSSITTPSWNWVKTFFSLPMWSICIEINLHLFEDHECNVLQLKSSLSSLIDWALSFVPNFSSSSSKPFRFSTPLGWLLLLYTFHVCGLFFFFGKLLFIKKVYQNDYCQP